ncbi:hypothetical protein NCG89_08420 [Spongiibacter taiwanensis]|uniref:hypothetical protein n=1 Tax=Spongiibacter taiwanensis TaxID=1748242 RepID=UPI0020358872|nr:hypothetical protein [Spongiibacter taiwanensis]USA44772.1 hypothetical protein NCG89_08420 [Spongiibacter taiwanensis]
MAAQPVPRQYAMWKLMAWSGPIFFIGFFVMWGLLARNFPPMAASTSAEGMWEHYKNLQMEILIGMSVCIVLGSCYMTFGAAVSRVMRRIEDGEEGMLSNIEMLGSTITCCPIIVACGLWLTGGLLVDSLAPETIQMLYMGAWMIIDLAYMVTSWQIIACSVCFMRDKREKKLVPNYVSWWGFVTVASFFPVSLIPFFKTGPFAFHGLFNFWVAFPTWYIWIVLMSIYVIKAVYRLEAEEKASESVSAGLRGASATA